MVSKPRHRILITTGDPDGIGWEVTMKALNALGPKSGVQYVCYRAASSTRLPKRSGSKWTRKFKLRSVPDLNAANSEPFDARTIIEIHSTNSPAHWVEEAAKSCLRGEYQALVTAPLSKTTILAAGFKDIGHTEILARVTHTRDLFMGFCGNKFSVLLATGHLPLEQAINSLSPTLMTKAVQAAEQLRRLLPAAKQKLPLAVVGLNPHAGEGGLIGGQETWFRSLIQALGPRHNVLGPLVPDTAFLPANWAKHSVYVCPYHDQGLIPFKMIHGFRSGVHLTLGLPFVRTSVDHGTAKDLYGKNQAQFGSMKDAVLAALRIVKENVQ